MSNKPPHGQELRRSLRWYPIYLLMYAAGIAALSVRNYPILAILYRTCINSPTHTNPRDALIVRVLDEMAQIDRGFRCLPAYTRSPVPCSDYILDVLRPEIDRLLFLGETYERFFDDLEMISALVYADITEHQSGRFWAAPGRFAYKSRSSTGPMQSFITDAASKGEDMPFLKIGLFSSSVTRFEQTTKAYLQLLTEMKSFR
jgi:hypothetical protein